ncbi:MAG: Gfo/Idh/MocA family oxidoreductase [bacterium]|nr:Gfo/Idh/MocA family oxidoreductase [bacterium]
MRHGVAMIGLGMACAPHARSLLALAERVRCHAVWSPSEERRAGFAQRHRLPAVTDVAQILDDERIGAVLLITPPNARRELVEALAARGKHILMEKPVERTTAAATELVERCEAAGVRLGIVFQHRFREASVALRARVQSGALGEIHSVQVNVPWWREQGYYDEPGRGTYARDGGGVLISQAIHTLDLMLSLTGPVSEVAAVAATSAVHAMESEDFVGAGLRFASGAHGALMATTALYPGSSESLTLAGSRGTATLDAGALRVQYRDGRSETVGESGGTGGGADPMAFPHHWHQRLIEDFLDALDEGRDPLSSGRSALAVHRLIDALLQSARGRRHVTVAQ